MNELRPDLRNVYSKEIREQLEKVLDDILYEEMKYELLKLTNEHYGMMRKIVKDGKEYLERHKVDMLERGREAIKGYLGKITLEMEEIAGVEPKLIFRDDKYDS